MKQTYLRWLKNVMDPLHTERDDDPPLHPTSRNYECTRTCKDKATNMFDRKVVT